MTDKTVAEKARVKPGATIAVLNPAPNVVESLGFPADVRYVDASEAQHVLMFAGDRADLEELMPSAASKLTPGAALWVFFKKGQKAAGADINRDSIWAVAEPMGMRPLGLLSVDSVWSVFRFKPGAPAS